jgi:hypothetical protein
MVNAIIDLFLSGAKKQRSAPAARRYWVCFVTSVAVASSCGTGRVPRPEPKPMAADLYCDRDDECEILDWVGGGCCAGGGEAEPYAISRVAVERHQVEHTVSCKDVDCGDDPLILHRREPVCRTELGEWIAVCSGHVCRRRSIHLFLPAKTTGCDDRSRREQPEP